MSLLIDLACINHTDLKLLSACVCINDVWAGFVCCVRSRCLDVTRLCYRSLLSCVFQTHSSITETVCADLYASLRLPDAARRKISGTFHRGGKGQTKHIDYFSLFRFEFFCNLKQNKAKHTHTQTRINCRCRRGGVWKSRTDATLDSTLMKVLNWSILIKRGWQLQSPLICWWRSAGRSPRWSSAEPGFSSQERTSLMWHAGDGCGPRAIVRTWVGIHMCPDPRESPLHARPLQQTP